MRVRVIRDEVDAGVRLPVGNGFIDGGDDRGRGRRKGVWHRYLAAAHGPPPGHQGLEDRLSFELAVVVVLR